MIALAIVVSSIFISSLAFANTIHKRMLADENRPTRESIAEKRRILERDRKEWMFGLSGDREMRASATRNIFRIDRELLALADEEARCID